MDRETDGFLITDEQAEEIIEAMLFATGYPVEYSKICEILARPLGQVKEIVHNLQGRLESESRGIRLVVLGNSVQLCSKEEYEDYVRAVLGVKQRGRLSASALEVLAIIAYNQPITKAVIEQIRGGADCSYAITTLSEKSLIEVKGKLDVPGKPNLYGTTSDFLRVFGIESLDDLPKIEGEEGQQITIEGI